MSVPLEKVVSDLQNSVGEAIAVFAEQGAGVDAARQQANNTRERFDNALEQWRNSPDAKQRFVKGLRSGMDVGSVQDRLDASSRLSVRWDRALCDIQDAAQELSQIIRAIRLVQVENEGRPTMSHSPPVVPPDETAASEDAAARKARKLEIVSQFMGPINAYHDQVQQFYNEKIQRTEQLLQEAQIRVNELTKSGA